MGIRTVNQERRSSRLQNELSDLVLMINWRHFYHNISTFLKDAFGKLRYSETLVAMSTVLDE